MAIHGTLATMSLTDLLQFLGAGRKTGTLKFDRGKITKQVYFKGGLIVGSRSNDPKEYLGQVLLHYGKLNESQLQQARETQRTSGAKLGEAIVQLGYLTEEDILDILKTRTLDAIYDLFVWTDGHFEFIDDEPAPDDLIMIEVEPTTVIMEGIYRLDELARYRSVVTSDRAVLELGTDWASSTKIGNDLRQILAFVERRMSVAEICYHMHASPFHVYGLIFQLINQGFARVAHELPEPFSAIATDVEEMPEGVTEMVWSAERRLQDDPDAALDILHRALVVDPKNKRAQELLNEAEEQFIKSVYERDLAPDDVPKIVMAPSDLNSEQLSPQEGFLLSRINGSWDIQSILSICPFREADSLRMMRNLLTRGVIGV
jgi:signal transduction histidine kinase